MTAPYYSDDLVTLYHGDALDVIVRDADVLVTDPPYPNNAGHFVDDVATAKALMSQSWWREAIVFWNELEPPSVYTVPLVAVHIWHRTNVNGRPYEAAFHFAEDGRKRRSEVMQYPAIFDGAGPGCREYVGHPTQKPVVIMRRLIEKTQPGRTIIDPFAGSGSTLVAAKYAGRRAFGVERNERYCEIAAKRLSQDVLDFGETRIVGERMAANEHRCTCDPDSYEPHQPWCGVGGTADFVADEVG